MQRSISRRARLPPSREEERAGAPRGTHCHAPCTRRRRLMLSCARRNSSPPTSYLLLGFPPPQPILSPARPDFKCFFTRFHRFVSTCSLISPRALRGQLVLFRIRSRGPDAPSLTPPPRCVMHAPDEKRLDFSGRELHVITGAAESLRRRGLQSRMDCGARKRSGNGGRCGRNFGNFCRFFGEGCGYLAFEMIARFFLQFEIIPELVRIRRKILVALLIHTQLLLDVDFIDFRAAQRNVLGGAFSQNLQFNTDNFAVFLVHINCERSFRFLLKF